LIVFTLNKGEEGITFAQTQNPDLIILDAAFGPGDGSVLAATISGMIVQWDRETGSEIKRFTGHDGGV